MKIPPVYTIDSEILELISKIEANKTIIYKVPKSVIDKIQRTNILKMAVFSARIEGNTLTLKKFENENENTILLPPRQEEILNIIKDHKIVSFDTIKRRFLKVPERTLRYDLKKLLDKGFINKIGKTKSTYYSSK